jgi:hypothetical protein
MWSVPGQNEFGVGICQCHSPDVMRWSDLGLKLCASSPNTRCVLSSTWPHRIPIHSLLNCLKGSRSLYAGPHGVCSGMLCLTYCSIGQDDGIPVACAGHRSLDSCKWCQDDHILESGVLACVRLSLSMPSLGTALRSFTTHSPTPLSPPLTSRP